MLRTFNYTGRRRICQTEALFDIETRLGRAPVFSADIKLDKGSYPENASVYVDAWYKENRQRFSYGKVGEIVPPANTILDEIEITDGIQFKVLVVDETGKHALVLGSGSFRIAGDDPKDHDRRSLVSVVARDLGAIPWEVAFDEESRPTLYINRNIPNPIEKMRSDPVFQSLILPVAMRDILKELIFSESVCREGETYRQWLAFAQTLTDRNPEDDSVGDMQSWLDDVMDEFCSRFELVERLANSCREED